MTEVRLKWPVLVSLFTFTHHFGNRKKQLYYHHSPDPNHQGGEGKKSLQNTIRQVAFPPEAPTMRCGVRPVPNLHDGKVKMSHMNHRADDEDTWFGCSAVKKNGYV